MNTSLQPKWPMKRLKYTATINDKALSEDTNPDYEIQYIDIGNVDSAGTIHDVVEYRFEDAPSRARRIVQDGDVIISTVRTYLQAIAPIEDPPDNLIVSTGFAVVRPRKEILYADFCKFSLREPSFIAEVVKRSVGVSYPAINSSELGDIPVCLPPIEQQSVIYSYLNKETNKLDAMLAAKQRLLDLIEEKRRALITRVVTRGPNPDVEMKDSGVKWLGQIPRNWTTKRVKYLFRLVTEPAPPDNDFELLSLYTEVGVLPRKDIEARGNKATTTDNYWLVKPGDLVVNKLLAWMGAFGVSDYEGVTSPAYDILRPLDGVNTLYYHHLFRCGICFPEFRRRSTGIMDMRLRLYFDEFGDMRVPLPPPEEQHAIIEHIKRETAKLDNLKIAAERTIGLLKERRAALISAAVTGKIEAIA